VDEVDLCEAGKVGYSRPSSGYLPDR
jgi:hypothetical protein